MFETCECLQWVFPPCVIRCSGWSFIKSVFCCFEFPNVSDKTFLSVSMDCFPFFISAAATVWREYYFSTLYFSYLYFIRGWWQIYFVGKIKIKLFVDSLVQHNKLLRYCKIFFQPHLHLWHHLCLFFNWFQIYCEISAKLRNIQIYKLSQ